MSSSHITAVGAIVNLVADGKPRKARRDFARLQNGYIGSVNALQIELSYALVRRIAKDALGNGKPLGLLYSELQLLQPEQAAKLVAEALAKLAAFDPDLMNRSKLYKRAWRLAGIPAASEAFVARGVKVVCPLHYRHPVEQLDVRYGRTNGVSAYANA